MIEYSSEKLGLCVKRYRLSNRMTQKQLSEISKLSEVYIGEIERGLPKNISIDTMQKLSKSLNVSLDDLARDNLIIYNRQNTIMTNADILLKNILNEISLFSKEQLVLFYELINIFKN